MLFDFENVVEGVKVGDFKIFDLNFLVDYYVKDLVGQIVQFDIIVKQVQVLKLLEVDVDFVISMGVVDGDVVKMCVEIEVNLKCEVKCCIEGKVKDQVMEVLIKVNLIIVLIVFVDMEIQCLMQVVC